MTLLYVCTGHVETFVKYEWFTNEGQVTTSLYVCTGQVETFVKFDNVCNDFVICMYGTSWNICRIWHSK